MKDFVDINDEIQFLIMFSVIQKGLWRPRSQSYR